MIDKKFQLQVEIPLNNIIKEIPLNKKFQIEQIFFKFKTDLIKTYEDKIPENFIKNILIKKFEIKKNNNYEQLNFEQLLKYFNIYDCTSKSSYKLNHTFRIGIIWNDDFNDFEWINYDKVMY